MKEIAVLIKIIMLPIRTHEIFSSILWHLNSNQTEQERTGDLIDCLKETLSVWLQASEQTSLNAAAFNFIMLPVLITNHKSVMQIELLGTMCIQNSDTECEPWWQLF